LGGQVFRRGTLPRVQRGPKGAQQSAGYSGDHVIQCGGIFWTGNLSAVFLLVEMFDATVDTEVERFVKAFQVGGAVWSGMFLDHEPTCMSD
jgi:hypothetical protein